jgi:ribosomal protein S18 acetylase RimI-like enzyme
MQIIPVETQADLKAFVELPYQLYRHDHNWVAPLRDEQMAQFDIRKNPMLEHCEYALFLAKKDGRVVGRISSFLDKLALEYWKEPIGLFGSYESIQDDSIARALLQACEGWLKERQMRKMRGPWSFASQEWGLVYKGFTPPPMIMAPYNPPWYNDQLERFGLQKVKDLVIYYIDTSEGYVIPDRILKLTDRIQKRYQVKVRPVNMKDLSNDVITIVDLANKSIADNWGFYPVTEAEGRAMARDMKMIVNPQALLIAEDRNGQPIGFAMSLPNINKLIKGLNGRLFPFGIFKVLFGLKKLHEYRMWALGVIPEYQGRAIDTLLYRATHEALYSPHTRLEINYVLEDNDRMNNAIMKLGAKPLRIYRIYEKSI